MIEPWIKKELLIISVLSLIMGCSSQKSVRESYIENEDYTTEDFLNDDAYQVIGKGRWPEEYINKRQIEKSKEARNNAFFNAQKKIIEIFTKFALKVKDKKGYSKEHSEEVFKKIENYGKSGDIVKTTYDDEFNCSVVYRVTVKDLKKMAYDGFNDIE